MSHDLKFLDFETRIAITKLSRKHPIMKDALESLSFLPNAKFDIEFNTLDKRGTLNVILKSGHKMEYIGHFSLVEMYLDSYLTVTNSLLSVGTYVSYHQRGKGIATIFAKLKEDICKELDYESMIALVYEGNEPQTHTLLKTNWVKVCKIQEGYYLWIKQIVEGENK